MRGATLVIQGTEVYNVLLRMLGYKVGGSGLCAHWMVRVVCWCMLVSSSCGAEGSSKGAVDYLL